MTVKVAPSHTIGIEFASKFVTLGQNRIKLQIWDTGSFIVF
jgi:GTPase SAR1 family protein